MLQSSFQPPWTLLRHLDDAFPCNTQSRWNTEQIFLDFASLEPCTMQHRENMVGNEDQPHHRTSPIGALQKSTTNQATGQWWKSTTGIYSVHKIVKSIGDRRQWKYVIWCHGYTSQDDTVEKPKYTWQNFTSHYQKCPTELKNFAA